MNEISFIKLADELDAYDIAYVNAISWQEAYRNIVPDEILDNILIEQWALGWMQALHNNANVFVLCNANKIAGFAQICEDKLQNPIQGELNAIYLHPGIWGKGYGKKLYRFSSEKLKELGCREVIVWVLADNERARKFYEVLGFKQSGASRICGLLPCLQLNELQYVNKL